MNWKQIKAEWQRERDERWTHHPKGHLAKKKQRRQNTKR